MNELQKQEIFEIEVLQLLNNKGFLKNLIFGGGTMLRLCYELPRFSLDLDFWTYGVKDFSAFFKKINSELAKQMELTDSAEKFYTYLLELRKPGSLRKLKIEIRKTDSIQQFQEKIAFSKFSDRQVLVRTYSLKQMLQNKVDALIGRKEIRDAFDIEFILKKGIEITQDEQELVKVKKIIQQFGKKEYNVTLGSILDPRLRDYYKNSNFEYLISKISERLSR